MGVTEAQVQKQGADQLSVSLPGVTDIQHALAIIGKTAQLEFYEDYKWRVAGPANTIADVVKQAKAQTKFVIPAADLRALAKGRQTKGWRLITALPGNIGQQHDDGVLHLQALARHDWQGDQGRAAKLRWQRT